MTGTDPHIKDGDLVLRPERGFAYQADLTPRAYGDDYADKFEDYDRSIEFAVNSGRVEMLRHHLRPGASVLDYGAGNGNFVIRACMRGFFAKGYEVIPTARSDLARMGLYADLVEPFDAVCAWDVIEHLPHPAALLRRIRGLFFASLPIFEDLARIRESKHYRPGEHLWHFTDAGFVYFLAEQGFELLERSNHEIEAGRESIGAYAFRRFR